MLPAAFGDVSATYDAFYMKMHRRLQGHGENITVYMHEKLHLLVDYGLHWLYPAARQYVIDSLADPVQAALFTVQPQYFTPQDFIIPVLELQWSATQQAQESHIQESLKSLA